MRFGHLEIFVADPLRAKEFYEGILGFEVTTIQAGKYVWLRHGENQILLRPGAPPAPAGRYSEAASGIVLYTDDLLRTSADLERRGLRFRGTVDSEKCLTFTDPDGNWFQLVNPEDH